MQLDLGSIDDILEWDFSLKFKGRREPTRPLLLADLLRLANLKEGRKDMIEALVTLIAQPDAEGDELEKWAAGIRAWIGKMRMEHMSAAINGVVQYATQVMSKNSQAIASRIAEAMAPEKTSSAPSGSSTPPSSTSPKP